MATLDERAAMLESNMAEQTRRVDDVRDALLRLEERIDTRFTQIDTRFATLDEKIDRRFDSLDDKFSRYFVWMLGAQVTTLAAVVAALT